MYSNSMMFKELLLLACVVIIRCQNGGEPVDCALSDWSAWISNDGLFEFRSRKVTRHAQNGGKRCIGHLTQYRKITVVQRPSVDKFLSKFIPGDRDTLPLGGHLLQRGEVPLSYTKSRDLAVAIDTTVFPIAMPLYISVIANMVGAMCGDIGNSPEDNIVSVITYGHTGANVLHAFGDIQNKAVIQNKILSVASTGNGQHSSLVGEAMALAEHEISTNATGARPNNLTNKDVLLFTTYRTVCSESELQTAIELKAAGRVYVIVLEGDGSTPPSDWCLKQYASKQVDFHFLTLFNFKAIKDLALWVIEITSPDNPCVRSPPPSKLV